MKLCLNNKIPVLTEEDIPSWSCPETCCFHLLYMGRHPSQICYRLKEVSCKPGYFYSLQNKTYDIFKL